MGSMWLLRGLRGCSQMYVFVTGSMWLVWSLRGCYGVSVVGMESTCLLRGLCGWYEVYVFVTGSMWLVWSLRVCYGVYVVGMESTCLLRGLCGWYGVYVFVTVSSWLLRSLYMTLTGSLPRAPRNSHVQPVIDTYTPEQPRHSQLQFHFAKFALRGCTGLLYVKVWPRDDSGKRK